MPERIQRKRSKGWKMPLNTVNVTRPGRWGNPYSVEIYGSYLAMQLFRETFHGCWNPTLLKPYTDALCDLAYQSHHRFLKRIGGHPLECIGELHGKNLACWCPLDQPCHADVLLAAANTTGIEGE